MAKRTKTAARAGKVKKVEKPDWVALEPKEEVEEDADLDDGCFMYDDTKDFLPAGWDGKVKTDDKQVSGLKKMTSLTAQPSLTKLSTDALILQSMSSFTVSTASQRVAGEAGKDKIMAPDLKEQGIIASLPISKTKLSAEAPEFQSLLTSIERVTLESDCGSSETVQQAINEAPTTGSRTEAAHLAHLRSPSGAVNSKKILASRLRVSASLLRQPTATIEELQKQVYSLKQALKTTKLKLEEKVQKKEEEIQRLHIELNDKNCLRAEQLSTLKKEKKESEEQRMKATNDYRKLMNIHASVKGDFDELKKKWVATNFNVKYAENQLEKFKEQDGVQKSRIFELEADQQWQHTRLANTIAQHQRERGGLASQLESVRGQLAAATRNQQTAGRLRSAAHTRLQQLHDDLELKFQDAEQEVHDLKADNQVLENKVKAKEKELRVTKAELLSKCRLVNSNAETIKDLKSEVSQLEADRALKAPILQIGIDVRLRNFEHARETVLNVSRDLINRAIIMNGNVAAHRANGAVDAAIF